jgi:hypothetical protein
VAARDGPREAHRACAREPVKAARSPFREK